MVGEVIGERYELEELVGAGGMSNVYKARDTLLDRHVALKVLHEYYTDDEEYVERFRREARAVAQLSHPNIVTVIDRGEDGGRQFIVFEYVDGQTLKQCVDAAGPLPVRRALELAIEVARGLAFAHEAGLIHRDVKPQNVILNGDGRAKVTDFGIARSLDVEGVTQTGTVVGTSNYISPEQASGSPVDAKTDVYALGVVLFELLTGRVPFPGESFVAVALQHVHEPPPDVAELRPDVPPRVADAIARALEKDPAARFASMRQFAAELEACLSQLDGGAEGDATLVRRAPFVRPRRRRARAPWIVVALALALLAAAVAALVAARDRDATARDVADPPAQRRSVELEGAAVHDPPPGDGREHDAEVGNAVDGDPATYWPTETYQSFQKEGVGIVLDASAAVELATLTLVTDTPGFRASIHAGAAAQGPFHEVAGAKDVAERTTFEISGARERYYVIWITRLSGVAHVNEVTATAARA